MKTMNPMTRSGDRTLWRWLPEGLALVLVGATIALARCDRHRDSAPQAVPSGTAEPGEVRLGYFANLTHAQAVLGVSSGEFEKAIAPKHLKTQIFNAGPSLVEALFAGEIDIGYIGPGPALSAFEKSHGQDVVVLAGAACNGVVIVAAPNSGIAKMEDLKGKRLATPQMGNTQDISARHYLTHELKQANADNVLPVPNAEQASMMSRGQIDAAWAPEPWGARLEAEAGGKVIAEERDLWPGGEFVLTVIIARPQFVAQHPDIVEDLLAAHAQWTARLQDDAQQQVPALRKALLDLTGKNLDEGVLRRAIARVKFSNEPSPQTFATFAQWNLDLGFSHARLDLAKLIDTSILRRALADDHAMSPRGNPSP